MLAARCHFDGVKFSRTINLSRSTHRQPTTSANTLSFFSLIISIDFFSPFKLLAMADGKRSLPVY